MLLVLHATGSGVATAGLPGAAALPGGPRVWHAKSRLRRPLTPHLAQFQQQHSSTAAQQHGSAAAQQRSSAGPPTLPSSTPHWSKELMPHTKPAVAMRCSYRLHTTGARCRQGARALQQALDACPHWPCMARRSRIRSSISHHTRLHALPPPEQLAQGEGVQLRQQDAQGRPVACTQAADSRGLAKSSPNAHWRGLQQRQS